MCIRDRGQGGSTGFLVSSLTGLQMDATTERLLFLGFFIAFAIKAPMVPLHTWLPDAAEAATPATSTLLVGVLDKVGTFGMIRFCLQLFPNASQWATPVVIALALLSIVSVSYTHLDVYKRQGWSIRIVSTSIGLIFSPPRLMISLRRPVRNR